MRASLTGESRKGSVVGNLKVETSDFYRTAIEASENSNKKGDKN